MTKEIFNYRYYFLLTLFSAGAILVLGEEAEVDSTIRWALHVVLDKVSGIVICAIAIKLAATWHKRNKIPFLSKFVESEA